MLWLWLFWIETILLAAYLLWSLASLGQARPLTGYQWPLAALYAVALLWSLVSFAKFARRRLGKR